MDIKDNLTPLSDDDLDRVTGGTNVNSNDRTDYCDACKGGGKKMSRNESGGVQLICQNCGKIYASCPVCGASWRPTVAMQTGGIFKCTGGHSFTAYW